MDCGVPHLSQVMFQGRFRNLTGLAVILGSMFTLNQFVHSTDFRSSNFSRASCSDFSSTLLVNSASSLLFASELITSSTFSGKPASTTSFGKNLGSGNAPSSVAAPAWPRARASSASGSRAPPARSAQSSPPQSRAPAHRPA